MGGTREKQVRSARENKGRNEGRNGRNKGGTRENQVRRARENEGMSTHRNRYPYARGKHVPQQVLNPLSRYFWYA
jgi:hypothetical protein